MPATPCWSFKTTPDPVVPPLPAPTIISTPTVEAYCVPGSPGDVFLIFDHMPVFDREPDHIPDVPGGGLSYIGGWIEYTDLGYSPGPTVRTWQGAGATNWDIYLDGVLYGFGTLNLPDGTPGIFSLNLLTALDWTQPHTVELRATYHDRPDYNVYYFDPATIGIIAFGGCGFSGCNCTGTPCYCNCPGKCGCPPCCCELLGAPSIGWDSLGYWQPWVSAHHDVSDVNGPCARAGGYLGLTGPWGSNVLKQHLSSNEACLCCEASCQYLYGVSLLDIQNQVTYPEITFAVTTGPIAVTPCPSKPPARSAVFNPLLAHKVN